MGRRGWVPVAGVVARLATNSVSQPASSESADAVGRGSARAISTLAQDAGTDVVRPGDTLWDVAASQLGDPYRWPR